MKKGNLEYLEAPPQHTSWKFHLNEIALTQYSSNDKVIILPAFLGQFLK
jgi:hypothetical protein